MIHLCSNNLRQDLIEYIGTDYYRCLYLYIDLIKYGCQSEYTKSWQLIEDGEVKAIMLSYHSALHIFAKQQNFKATELACFIKDLNPSIICADANTIKHLAPFLLTEGYEMEIGYIGKYDGDLHMGGGDVEKASMKDVTEIATLLYEDDDIGASYTFDDLVSQIRERLSQGFVRSFVIKQDAKVVAHLGTGAEIDKLCTICYVITDPNYRGKGLSSALFCYACQQLESEGKEIFSVYYPENSRRLHHKLGFVDCCEFGKLFKNIQ